MIIFSRISEQVTDDLFDEIATRVLSEEEAITEGIAFICVLTFLLCIIIFETVDSVLHAAALNQFSAKALLPYKSKRMDGEEDTINPSSELQGGLLGLVRYGTGSDDENDEISTRERMNNKKHDSIRNGHSPDENVPDDTKSMKKLDATSSMGAKNTGSFGGGVVEELVSGTKVNDRKQQNGISSLEMKNNLPDREKSNEYMNMTKEFSSPELRNASDKRAIEKKNEFSECHRCCS